MQQDEESISYLFFKNQEFGLLNTMLKDKIKALKKEEIKMDKVELQKIIDDMKEPLMEYWTNELHLPIDVQCHSMAIMDMFIDNLGD